MLQITAVRLPTCQEWDDFMNMKAVSGCNEVTHWESMYSWCQDVDQHWASCRAVRGFSSAHDRNIRNVTTRDENIGFRPVFEILDTDALPSDEVMAIGTLYMDGEPVRVPQVPVWNGDIPDYIPGVRLEIREALDNPAYQVQAIKVDNILIADRNLLKCISWSDAQTARVCQPGQDICTWNVPAVIPIMVQANSLEEALSIASRKANHMGASLLHKSVQEYLDYLQS